MYINIFSLRLSEKWCRTYKHPAIDLFELIEEGAEKRKERFAMQNDGNKGKQQGGIK